MLVLAYGGRGTVLLLGAISLHIVFAGALLKSPNSTYQMIENESDGVYKSGNDER